MTQSGDNHYESDLDALLLDLLLDDDDDLPSGHLSDERLKQLAVQGGWELATEQERAHLSGCTACLNTLLIRVQIADSRSNVIPFPTRRRPKLEYGLLEAAGTGGISSPVTCRSAGGDFVLRILPERNQPGRGLVTLEYTGAEQVSEGSLHTVKDSAGHTLLQAPLRAGRAAAHVDNLDQVDLSHGWTLTAGEETDGA